jgi:hypothetical protein
LLEISNVHTLSLHDLHDDAVHVVEMRVTVAGPTWRGARQADVATGTTHAAVPRPWNTGHTVQTRQADVATGTTHTAVPRPWNTGHTVQTRDAPNTW